MYEYDSDSNILSKNVDHCESWYFCFCLFIISLLFKSKFMAKQDVTIIKEDAIIQIDVSGAYYNRVVDLMSRLIERQPDIKQALINIDTEGTKLNLSEAVIQTYMMLIKSVEDAANKDSKKYTEVVQIELPDEDISEDPS